MTFLEKIKELLATIGLLPLIKILFSKPIYTLLNLRFKRSSNEAITKFHQAIKSSGTRPWLAFGSYLGAYREKKIIAHDFDIDFAINSHEELKNLETELIKLGFKNIRSIKLKESNKIVEKTFAYKGAHIDIFIAFEEGDHFVTYDFSSKPGRTWGQTIDELGGLRAHKNTFKSFNLEEIEFMEMTFWAPAKESAHTYLTELYGEDYNIPNPKWHLDQRSVRVLTNGIGIVY